MSLQDYFLDETVLNWILSVLIVLFMFCAGLVIVNFPWMFMGEITCEYCVEVSRFQDFKFLQYSETMCVTYF